MDILVVVMASRVAMMDQTRVACGCQPLNKWNGIYTHIHLKLSVCVDHVHVLVVLDLYEYWEIIYNAKLKVSPWSNVWNTCLEMRIISTHQTTSLLCAQYCSVSYLPELISTFLWVYNENWDNYKLQRFSYIIIFTLDGCFIILHLDAIEILAVNEPKRRRGGDDEGYHNLNKYIISLSLGI